MKNNWTDRELTSAIDDSFGFQDFANALSARILSADTPLTIGVFGRWGSGKTSLMKLLETTLS
jgi:ABC-type bacteriocin/lantibiotic exporter with double-glycine peptidase domain